MTDNEIIKALECCMDGRCEDDCPFGETREHCYNLDSLTLDLINRQKAEIERLRKANENFSCLGKMYSEIKSEARKEFAERFWAESAKILGTNTLYWIKEIKNKLLAEMESDGK